jgi:hypothetical protein
LLCCGKRYVPRRPFRQRRAPGRRRSSGCGPSRELRPFANRSFDHAENLQRFDRRPDLLARFDALLPSYSISCIFADVTYRQNVKSSAIKPPFRARTCGQAITVQLSGGDLVDACGDTEVSVCGGLTG